MGHKLIHISKQCRPRKDCSEWAVFSGSHYLRFYLHFQNALLNCNFFWMSQFLVLRQTFYQNQQNQFISDATKICIMTCKFSKDFDQCLLLCMWTILLPLIEYSWFIGCWLHGCAGWSDSFLVSFHRPRRMFVLVLLVLLNFHDIISIQLRFQKKTVLVFNISFVRRYYQLFCIKGINE